ncbi:MAG TPA: GNAT family N-acetyltransferase [Streptosporangiaceae bacterium]
MSEYTIKALGPDTWDAFAALAQRHGGGGFGCWCTWFHRDTHASPASRSTCTHQGHGAEQGPDASVLCGACPYGVQGTQAAGPEASPAVGTLSPRCGHSGREVKEELVRQGRAHAALVFDGDVAVGWCQYGTPEELPGIHHRKEYLAGATRLPDYRLTCFFVDRKYRRKGVASAALSGALELIALQGGGLVEGYPRDTGGKKVSASFLYSCTRSLFERAGFSYDRPKSVSHCVMVKTVTPSAQRAPAGC